MKANISVLLFLLNLIRWTCSSPPIAAYHPLILVPGLAGSREYFQSPREPKPRLVWIDLGYLERTEVLSKYMILKYNASSHTTYNPHGYEYVWEGWGDTWNIEKLSSFLFFGYTDYHGMIKQLLGVPYYKRNITLRGAPYDFRKAPNEMSTFFEKLRLLVEETFKNTGNTRVVLLGHSLGSLFSLSFLERMTVEWKKMYIRAFVSVSGPLGGAVKSLLMETTGKSVVPLQNPMKFREFERTFPSSAFLLPKPKYFANRTLVQTLKRKYTANSYQDLFKDFGIADGFAMYNDVKDLVDGSVSPTGVEDVYCIHGAKLKTIESFSINTFNDTSPCFTYGNGDGTVNKVSLEICQRWSNVKYRVIDGADHKKILHDKCFIKTLIAILGTK